MGRICPRGLPVVAWVLHELSYPLLVQELWPWSHLSLLFITVLRHWGLSRCRPLHGLSYPWVSWGDTVDALTWRRLILATPTPDDAFALATPAPGDASSWQRLKRSTCWLSSLGPLEGSHHTFDFDFDFGQRPGTRRYILFNLHAIFIQNNVNILWIKLLCIFQYLGNVTH